VARVSADPGTRLARFPVSPLARAVVLLVCLGARDASAQASAPPQPGAPVAAPTPACPSVVAALESATTTYALGQYQEVIAALARCQIRLLPLADEGRAYELLAKAYLLEARFADAEAAVKDLIRVRRDYQPALTDPPLLAELVEEARRRLVRSVSKFPEDWREAPATVSVVTAADIARRGYRDVEEVLHDLPGFDVIRGNGDLYSTFYQRGYRSNATDRTLVFVDGIEQNDLHSNIAYISRQYPLTSVDRIEVMYGPFSTIYGPNAFSGVINIITREPDAMIGDAGSHAGRLQTSYGAFNTALADVTYAGRSADRTASWSVTVRRLHSDEPDLSGEQWWRYDLPARIPELPYAQGLVLEGRLLDRMLCSAFVPGAPTVNVLGHPERCAAPTRAVADLARAVAQGLAEVRDLNGDGQPDLAPTPAAVQRAQDLDRQLWMSAQGPGVGFKDLSDDWFASGRVKFSNFNIGVQAWRSVHGTSPWYRDVNRGQGGTWVPRQASTYVSYARPINGYLDLNVLVSYRQSQIDDESVAPIVASYSSGYLNLVDLVDSTPGQFANIRVDHVSTQFRSEITAVYQRSDRWAGVAGVDVRDSSLQAGHYSRADRPLFSFTAEATPEEIKATDVGVFAQASYSWRRRLKAVLGLRYDGNEVRENEQVSLRVPGVAEPTLQNVEDFGKFLSPRAALVATMGQTTGWTRIPGRFIAKAVFSRASQQPSNFQRFATEPFVREFASPFLGRERATNTELSASWEPEERTRVEVAGFVTRYSDVLHTALKVDGCCQPAVSGQFQSIGAFGVMGLQASASTTRGRLAAYANYSYTEAENRGTIRDEFGDTLALDGQAVTRLPIGDIARQKLNVGVSARWWDRLDTGLRMNVVGRRPTGSATTQRLNSETVPGFTVVNATLAYRDARRGATLLLGVNNLFDKKYYYPGVRSAEYFGYVGRLPQPGVNAFVQLTWDVNVAKRGVE
jgi:outer membrane receptor for ferrienterochelin and colicins